MLKKGVKNFGLGNQDETAENSRDGKIGEDDGPENAFKKNKQFQYSHGYSPFTQQQYSYASGGGMCCCETTYSAVWVMNPKNLKFCYVYNLPHAKLFQKLEQCKK